MKNNIVIVNFSNRNDGNCSFIAHYLNDILNESRCNNMVKGFKCNKKEEELCKHCNFLEK
jgi:hypothetical protein